MINSVAEILKNKVSRFAADTNGQFAGERVLVSRRRAPVCEASVEYPTFKLSFMYHVGARRGPKSVLSCMFHIKSEQQSMGYLIYDILNIIDKDDFSPYTYSFIPDKQAFERCLDELCSKLFGKFDRINELFYSPEECAKLRDTKLADINNYFDRDVFKAAEGLDAGAKISYLTHIYDMFFAHIMTFFVSQCYAYYLDGDKKRALSLFNRARVPTEYQRRFMAYLGDDTPAQTTENNYLADGLTAQKKSALVLPTIAVMVLLGAILTPAFYLLHQFLLGHFAAGALYNTASELENALFCVFPALITSAGITAASRDFIITLTLPKTKEILKRFGKILFSKPKKTTVFYSVFTSVMLSVIASMLIANTGVKFFNKTMKINASFTQLRAIEYSYSDITEVTEQQLPYGATATTIKFSDGKMFSLVGVGENNSIKTKIYPILKDKGIEITKKALD